MMAAQRTETRLIGRLPPVRGRLRENFPLSGFSWFRVGGPAEVLYRPADLQDLVRFLHDRPEGVPITVVGVGSNLLVRDGGVAGVVIRLDRSLAECTVEGSTVRAGAGVLDLNVALAAMRAGLAGLEFLSGIPGTIGGAIRMNAGAYGREIKDVLIEATAVDGRGNLHRLQGDELGFGYRHCSAPRDWIFTTATLRAEPGDLAEIAKRIDEIRSAREGTQPTKARTGGSTFTNPPGNKAWQLIDEAGCRGLRIGGAMVSEKHCNFLINTGDATAADLEALGEEVRRRVLDTTGVQLQWEIQRIGATAGGGTA